LSAKRVEKSKECLYCKFHKKKVKDTDWKVVALDRPYLNLLFHASCHEKIGKNMRSFLQDSKEIWYNERRKD